MAYVIRWCDRRTDGNQVLRVSDLIDKLIMNSRFTCEIIPKTHRTRTITIRNVRLRIAKPYCGNHPGPCQAIFHRPHRKGTWLEGADWVAFNDMINDALDSLNIEANVSSSTVIVRKGKLRCVEYTDKGSRFGGNTEWIKDSLEFEDHCGNSIGNTATSLYPESTPGINTWRI